MCDYNRFVLFKRNVSNTDLDTDLGHHIHHINIIWHNLLAKCSTFYSNQSHEINIPICSAQATIYSYFGPNNITNHEICTKTTQIWIQITNNTVNNIHLNCWMAFNFFFSDIQNKAFKRLYEEEEENRNAMRLHYNY